MRKTKRMAQNWACILLFFSISNTQLLAESRHITVGIYGSIMQPLDEEVKEWYSTSSYFAGLLAYEFAKGRFRTEVEFHYTQFADAGLKNREVRWPITGEFIKSPNAKAVMRMSGIMINGMYNFSSSRIVPYLTGGIGGHRYRHHVSGRIHPGQQEVPLDPSILLPAYEESGSGQSVNVGGGIFFRLSGYFDVDFRVRWSNHSDIRLQPLLHWDIPESVSSVSSIQVMLGLRYVVL